MKKVLIIDDEKDARLLIRQYLKSYQDFEIIGECSNGIDAVAKINEWEPDLIFLDIQMPGLSGLQVVEQIVHVPQIIFTTAFDKYAIRAFENNAVDYLLKPYTADRFFKAVSKITLQNQQNFIRAQNSVNEISGNQYPIRILVESGNKLVNLDVLEIFYLEADRDYTRIHTENKSYLSNYGIGVLEQRMNPQFFLRIHRSHIVNIHHIHEVHKDSNSAQVIMKNNTVLNVSRSYMEDFKKHIY